MSVEQRDHRVAAWFCAAIMLALGALGLRAEPAKEPSRRVPVIDVTDLYLPPEDPGDNFDLIAAYALPEVDLRAVILDVTGELRQPVSPDPMLPDARGPRDPGFIGVTQLNSIFGRNIPCAAGPYRRMRTPDDPMRDVPAFQQQGIELLLKTMRESPEPVEIVSFGSARTVAAAFNRAPDLFKSKLRRLHLCAGSSEPGYIEWNVRLDPRAITRLLRSDLPVAIYPCATKDGPFAYGPHNCFWKLPDLRFIQRMDPALRRYLGYAFGWSQRLDFLRALEEDPPPAAMQKIYAKSHNVWETGVWLNVAGRRLVHRADGHCRIVAEGEVRPSDTVMSNELIPCRVRVGDDGLFTWEAVNTAGVRGKTDFQMYDRGDPKQNEAALREALPEWYAAIRPGGAESAGQ